MLVEKITFEVSSYQITKFFHYTNLIKLKWNEKDSVHWENKYFLLPELLKWDEAPHEIEDIPSHLVKKKEPYILAFVKCKEEEVALAPVKNIKFITTKSTLRLYQDFLNIIDIGIYYVLMTYDIYLKELKYNNIISKILDFKNVFYIWLNNVDEYLNFDENFNILNECYLNDLRYVNSFNYHAIYDSKKFHKYKYFYEYYEIAKHNLIKKNANIKIKIEAYDDLRVEYINPNTHIFWIYEMTLLNVDLCGFNIHHFSYFRKKNYEHKVLTFKQYYLKLDSMLYIFGSDYAIHLKRIRYQEYIRMHSFFATNYKMRQYYMEARYVWRAPYNIVLGSEMIWKKYIYYNLYYSNYLINSVYRNFILCYYSFDLNVLNLIQNASVVKYQKVLNTLNNRIHLSLRHNLFNDLEDGYHKIKGYRTIMNWKYQHKFDFRFVETHNLIEVVNIVLGDKKEWSIYNRFNQIQEELLFVNNFYNKTIVPYYLYLDFYKYKNLMNFNKTINYISFLYKMCDTFVLKFKSELNMAMAKILNYKDGLIGRETYMKGIGTTDYLNQFEKLFNPESIILEKQHLWSVVYIYWLNLNSKFEYLNFFYNSIYYYNWRNSVYSTFTYNNYGLTYNIFKSTYDFLYHNRYQQVYRGWKFNVHSYKQKFKLIEKSKPKIIKEGLKKVKELGVNTIDTLIYDSLFKFLYFQYIFESKGTDLIIFFLSKKSIINKKNKKEFLNLKTFINSKRYCILWKEQPEVYNFNISKECIDELVVNLREFDEMVHNVWVKKYDK